MLRWLPLIALFLLLPAVTRAADRPNFVVILADDQGRADYSAYGTTDLRTPGIDRLFREGLDFTNFYANCCVCSPTRASLLTGCYPDRVGVPGVIRDVPTNSWGRLADDAVLLPALLKRAGYHSTMVGKWHLGLESPDTPTERGFDFFHGFLGDMMDDYWTHLRNGHNFMRRNQATIDPQGHATDLFTDWACEYLAERASQQQPFFLYLAYNAPHGPIQPPEDWVAKVREREPSMPANRARLAALIEHMDAGIGRVLDTLDRLKLAENTLVIYSSDNGGVVRDGANVGPWRADKTHMYEGGLRVPGAARWPARIKAATKTERVTLTMDIIATLCEAAGVDAPATTDGVSFLPTLLGQAQPEPQRDLYFVRREGGAPYGGLTIQALRRGNWKLVHDSPYGPLELYNLADDPQETKNLASSEPKKLRELQAAMAVHIQRGGEVPWQRKRDK